MCPLVSVVTAAYRCEQFIGRMIESIQAQTYKNWELIIVDDGSDDHQCDVVKSFADKDERIHLLRQPHYCNWTAMNFGRTIARGEIIANQEADDWSHPTRFERQVAMLEKAKADVVSCLMTTIHMRRGVRHEALGRLAGGTGCIPREYCTRRSPKGPAFGTLLVRAAVYERIGGFVAELDGRITYAANSEWLFRALTFDNPPIRWAHVADELYFYWRHPQQMSHLHIEQNSSDHVTFQKRYRQQIMARLGEHGW